MRRTPDPDRKGGPNDPVAQSIRNEQRADAAPTASEVKAEHLKRLSRKGCQVCGEDDPSRLDMVRIPLSICSNGQQPDKPFKEAVFCQEHRRDGSTLKRARMIQSARTDDADILVVYECGATDTASWTPPTGTQDRPDRSDEFANADTHRKVMIGGEPPTVPAIHVGRGRCGAPIKEVIEVDG